MAKVRALFLDRDGTLILDAHNLKDPKELEIILLPVLLCKKPKTQVFAFLHTNQSGIRGYYDWSDVYACNARCTGNLAGQMPHRVCIARNRPMVSVCRPSSNLRGHD